MSDYYESKRRNRNSFRYYQQRRDRGWGMGLYRNRLDGKICGVAAGIADYWDVADWVVRLLFIGAFIFTGSLAVWAYLAGFFLLSPRPEDRGRRKRSRRRSSKRQDSFDAQDMEVDEDAYAPEMEYDERYHDYRPKRMFRYSESASIRLSKARERLDAAVRRVENMETYVTSRRFNLNREFSRL